MIEQLGHRLIRAGGLADYERSRVAAKKSRACRRLINRLDHSQAANLFEDIKLEVYPDARISFVPYSSGYKRSKDYIGVSLDTKVDDRLGGTRELKMEMRSLRGSIVNPDVMQLMVGRIETWLMPSQWMDRKYMEELVMAQLDQNGYLPAEIARRSAIQNSPLRSMYHGRLPDHH